MDDHSDALREPPQAWLDALARSDADIAAGRVVSGDEIKRRLRQTILDMQACRDSAELAHGPGLARTT